MQNSDIMDVWYSRLPQASQPTHSVNHFQIISQLYPNNIIRHKNNDNNNLILYFNALYQQPNGQLQIQHKQ
jgi:hypothetical protein